jgi:hypothetical protein
MKLCVAVVDTRPQLVAQNLPMSGFERSRSERMNTEEIAVAIYDAHPEAEQSGPAAQRLRDAQAVHHRPGLGLIGVLPGSAFVVVPMPV